MKSTMIYIFKLHTNDAYVPIISKELKYTASHFTLCFNISE